VSDVNIILVCGSRFALPTLHELAFFKQLAVVAIPEDCEDMIGETTTVLTGTELPVVILRKEGFADQLQNAIEKYNVNIGLVMTFGFPIPASVYSVPANGFFNVHPGPLPTYRGPDPIFQQIRNKEENAGVTLHQLSERMDSGPVVITEMIRLDPSDTHGILAGKLALVAAKLVRVLLKLVSFDLTIPLRPQNESEARYFKKQSAKEVAIKWDSMDADIIIALINACNPWNKGAITKINNKIIRIVEAAKTGEMIPEGIGPGTITAINDDGITIGTHDNHSILVRFVYVDEGFLRASRLSYFGVMTGHQFQNI
jgi:methionyl-tRNA formyltransferase